MFSHTVENDKASNSHGNLTRETASQRQRFLGLNKGPGIFLRMRQEAILLFIFIIFIFGSGDSWRTLCLIAITWWVNVYFVRLTADCVNENHRVCNSDRNACISSLHLFGLLDVFVAERR
jgi:hypothetical protein